MARFNETVKGRFTDPAKAETMNHEGAPAYRLGAELELYALAATSLLNDKFYTSAKADISRLRKLVSESSPEFVAKLAVYCREDLNLRTIPVVLAVELQKAYRGDESFLIRACVERIVQRPDEITELLGYFRKANPAKGKHALAKIPHSLRDGLARAFTKFDAYQLAKYKQEDKDITLRDALFVCHPKPKDEDQTRAFKALADKSLETPVTWETEVSAKGNKPEVWESLIHQKKLGYMATLRNLRNMLNAPISEEALQSVCAYLANEKAVLGSKQLPFRFVSAYRELLGEKTKNFDRRVTDALEKACQVAARLVKGFSPEDRVLVACDVSGSMSNQLSDKSSIHYYEVGLILAAYLNHAVAKCDVGVFSNDWKEVRLPSTNILETSRDLSRHFANGGTEGWKVLDALLRSGKSYTKVIFLTDCQWWETGSESWHFLPKDLLALRQHNPPKMWAAYKQANPEAKAYFIDLAGYGNTPIKVGVNDVWFVAGWNERVFEAVDLISQGLGALDLVNRVSLFRV